MAHKIHFSSACNSMIFTTLPRMQPLLNISFQLFSPSKIPHPHWQLSSRPPPAHSKHELILPMTSTPLLDIPCEQSAAWGYFIQSLSLSETLKTWQWVLSLLLSFLSLRGIIFPLFSCPDGHLEVGPSRIMLLQTSCLHLALLFICLGDKTSWHLSVHAVLLPSRSC